MIVITFQNVEKLVFLDHKLRKQLPDFNDLFSAYALSQQSPDLRIMGQAAFVEFVNRAQEEHIKVLREYFDDEVEVKKINLNVADHYQFHINDAEKQLNSIKVLKDYFFAFREGDQLYLSTWR